MDIASLQAFLAVARQGSFSLAAEQLFLTQPAISKRVSGLEEELSCRLFDRIGRHTTLTEAGRELLPRAERILQELEDSRRALSNLSGRVMGKLSVGTSHHIGLHRLPPVLRAYTSQYSEVELDLHFQDSEAACQAVERGELELAIVTLPLTPLPALKQLPIWDDPLSIVVGVEHPIAQQRYPTLNMLAGYTAILPAHGTYTREVLEQAIATYDIKLQVGLSTNYLETIKMMVSVGLGWSVLPNTMVDKELHVIPLKEVQLNRQLGVVLHTERTQSNAARALIELLTTVD